MSRPGKLRALLEVDASYSPDGWAALAVCRGRSPFVAEIVRADNSEQAEAWALVLGMEHAERAALGSKYVLFRTDSANLVRRVAGDLVRGQDGGPLIAQAREFLAKHPRWRIEFAPRRELRGPHTFCSQVMKAWRAGGGGRPTFDDRQLLTEAAR